jgi:hypothetical protein
MLCLCISNPNSPAVNNLIRCPFQLAAWIWQPVAPCLAHPHRAKREALELPRRTSHLLPPTSRKKISQRFSSTGVWNLERFFLLSLPLVPFVVLFFHSIQSSSCPLWSSSSSPSYYFHKSSRSVAELPHTSLSYHSSSFHGTISSPLKASPTVTYKRYFSLVYVCLSSNRFRSRLSIFESQTAFLSFESHEIAIICAISEARRFRSSV